MLIKFSVLDLFKYNWLGVEKYSYEKVDKGYCGDYFNLRDRQINYYWYIIYKPSIKSKKSKIC